MAKLQENGVCHSNLVQMIFCCWDRELLMLLEFCAVGSMSDLFDAAKVDGCAWASHITWLLPERGSQSGILHKFATDVAKGVYFMHQHDPPILHRDLKSQNVLIAGEKDLPDTWVAKVSNLGESREYEFDDNLSMVGTLCTKHLKCTFVKITMNGPIYIAMGCSCTRWHIFGTAGSVQEFGKVVCFQYKRLCAANDRKYPLKRLLKSPILSTSAGKRIWTTATRTLKQFYWT